MTILESLELPKTDPGYLRKADIAIILKDRYNVEYTESQIKKIKRDDLANELKKKIKETEAMTKSTKNVTKQRGKIKSAFYRMFSKFF